MIDKIVDWFDKAAVWQRSVLTMIVGICVVALLLLLVETQIILPFLLLGLLGVIVYFIGSAILISVGAAIGNDKLYRTASKLLGL